jgi:hypothetical protein
MKKQGKMKGAAYKRFVSVEKHHKTSIKLRFQMLESFHIRATQM